MFMKNTGYAFVVYNNYGKQISPEYTTEDEAYEFMQNERERW